MGYLDEPIPHSYITSSDGVSNDFGGLACPGDPQNWSPRTPFWGTPDGPLPHSYITSLIEVSSDFGGLACPWDPLKWGPKPPPWGPYFGGTPVSPYPQNH